MNDDNIDCKKYTYTNGNTGNKIEVLLWGKEIKKGFPIVTITVNKDSLELTTDDLPELIPILVKCICQ